jgi:IS1 family transposase/transposase-like protein
MNCRYCKNVCVKSGIRNGVQRYRCKFCKKYQQKEYSKSRISQEKYEWTVKLNNEGCGISNIARLLSISKSSVQRLIERMAVNLQIPPINESGQSYEIDEPRTSCRNKQNELWLIYAINRTNKRIIDFFVGRRTKENIAKVVSILHKLHPKHIYSDKLNIYESLLYKSIHKIYPRCTNFIERKNLTLRTHLKRLSRKTICFTKSAIMLKNCMQLYCYAA